MPTGSQGASAGRAAGQGPAPQVAGAGAPSARASARQVTDADDELEEPGLTDDEAEAMGWERPITRDDMLEGLRADGEVTMRRGVPYLDCYHCGHASVPFGSDDCEYCGASQRSYVEHWGGE